MSGGMEENRTAAGWVASGTMEAPHREVYGKLRLFTLEELEQLPEEEWLIDGILERGNFTCLYGPPGHGKSFLALDWSLHLATGRERWHERHVTPRQLSTWLERAARACGSEPKHGGRSSAAS